MDENASAAPEGEVEESGSTTPEEVLSIMGKEAPTAPEVPEEPAAGEEEPAAPEEPDTPPATPPATPPPASEPEVPADTPSFAVEVEDASGNKLTIEPGANLEEVLKDFEPKNNGQIFQIIKDVMKAETDKASWDTEQSQAAQQAEHAQAVADVQAGWDKEIEALQGSKRLTVGADGKPSEERITEVFTFMAQENEKRTQDGRPPIQSFEDALDKIELREKNEAEAQKAKDAKELAKKRGGIVGGSSAPATSGSPTYKGGARNSNEALRSMGML